MALMIRENKLSRILSQEAEWKNSLVIEIQNISEELKSTREKLKLKSYQFDQLRDAFTHNLKLLKEQEKNIMTLQDMQLLFKKDIHTKDALIGETQAALDRCQTELNLQRSAETKLLNQLDETRKQSVHREFDLHEQYSKALAALRQSEVNEKTQLQTTITRLKSDLETEKLRFESDLEESLNRVKKQAEDEAMHASQRYLGLELKLRLCEETCERVTQTKNNALEQMKMKDVQLHDLSAKLALTQKEVENLTSQLHDFTTANALNEQNLMAAETARSRVETVWEKEKQELNEQLNRMQAQVDWHKKELNMAALTSKELAAVASAEQQRLLEIISREKQVSEKAILTTDKANTARQMAERTARTTRAEVERLRKDLEQALLSPPVVTVKAPACGHQHLLEQLDRLKTDYNQLKHDNVLLRRSVNAMSEQAERSAQRPTPALPISSCDGRQTEQTVVTREKLRAAVGVIRQLAKERQTLIELNNRLHAKIRIICQNSNLDHLSKQSSLPTEKSEKKSFSTSTENQPQNVDAALSVCANNDQTWTFEKQKANPLILPLSDLEDSTSSVIGRESVSAIFKLLDGSDSNFGDAHINDEVVTIPSEFIINAKHKQLHSRNLCTSHNVQ